MRCWNCQSEVGGADACPSCGKVQPVAPGTTLFDVLGLPRGVEVDKAELERAYRERSLRLHPDRAGRDDPRERRLALERNPADAAAREEAAQALARLRYHHRFLEAAEGGDEEDR